MKKDMLLIREALEGSRWLISDEYSSVVDVELKQKYEEVLKGIEKALVEIRKES